MDKEKAKELLFAVVDGEASSIEKKAFEEYLQIDPQLKAIYELEMRFRGFVGDVSTDRKLPDSRIAQIRAQFDEIDAESREQESVALQQRPAQIVSVRPRRKFSKRYSFAMVASVALMVTGTIALISFGKHEHAFGAFENAHFIARDTRGNLGDQLSLTDAENFVEQKFGVDVIDTLSELSPCGGEVIKLDNNEFAHFKFCDQFDRPVSLFVGSAADFKMPDMPKTIMAGVEYFKHVCHGCELMYWKSGNAIIVAATEPDQMTTRPISSLINITSVVLETQPGQGVDESDIH